MSTPSPQSKVLADYLDSEMHELVYVRKMAFVHNKTKQPTLKSQDCALQFAAETNKTFIACYEHPRMGRMYGAFDNVDSFASHASQGPHYYELLPSSIPRWFYADLDFLQSGSSIPEEKVLDHFLEYVFNFVADRLGVTVNKDVNVACATGIIDRDANVVKCSYHVRFSFALDCQYSAKTFATALVENITPEGHPQLFYNHPTRGQACVMDKGVYNKNQTFRCLNNWKVVKQAQVKRPLKALRGSRLFKDHLLGVYPDVGGNLILQDSFLDVSQLIVTVPFKPLIVSDGEGDIDVKYDFASAKIKLSADLLTNMVNGLAADRAVGYYSWLETMFAIHHVSCLSGYPDVGLKLCHDFSAKSATYNAIMTDIKWKSMCVRENGFTALSLRKWLKDDNSALYKSLKQQMTREFSGSNSGCDRQWYRPNYENYENFERDQYNEVRNRPYKFDKDCLVIHSSPGTGKTFQAYKILHDYPRILVLSARQAYSQFFVASANRYIETNTAAGSLFEDYATCSGSLVPVDRLALQMESLHRIKGKEVDLVILDECESLLKQLSSKKTMTRHKECLEVLIEVLVQTPKLLYMDAYISDRTLNFVEQVRKMKRNGINTPFDRTDMSVTVHQNKWRPEGRIAIPIFGKNRKSAQSHFIEQLVIRLNKGEKVVVFTSSASFGEQLLQILLLYFGDKKSISFYSGATDNVKFKRDLKNVNESWVVDCLIYSPKILAGVSFDVIHFDCIFVYGFRGGCCVRDIFQAIIRVRHFKSPYMYYYLDTAGPVPADYYLTYNGVKENEMSIGELYNKYYVQAKDPAMQAYNQLEQRFIAHIRDNTFSMTELQPEMENLLKMRLKSERMPEFFVDIHVRNCLENNISCAHYSSIFHDFLSDSGFSVGEAIFRHDRRAPWIPGVNIAADEESEQAPVVDLERGYLAIPTIDATEALELRQRQFANLASEQDILKLQKFDFDNNYVKNMTIAINIREKVFHAVRTDARVRQLLVNLHAVMHLDAVSTIQDQVKNSPYLPMLQTETVFAVAVRKICQVLGLSGPSDTLHMMHESVLEQEALKEPLADALKLVQLTNPAKKIKTQINHILKHYGCELTGILVKHRKGQGQRVSHYEYNVSVKVPIVNDMLSLLTQPE